MWRALFQVFMHSASHIERLAAAYSLVGANSFAINGFHGILFAGRIR
jgi:hypothetical protein